MRFAASGNVAPEAGACLGERLGFAPELGYPIER
jgi:hypothetical protein